MGVPKFYRWLSERYPLINQAIGDSTLLPGFDNLYLDMNGIIHTATHGNDGMSKVKGEHEVVLLMIAYIDKIVKIAKPTKVLYLAIDGVAPRAKMNQQRSRRFRAARDTANAKEAARAAGEIVNDDEVFDSNCITPGTEFMARVSLHLKYFIRKKIREDLMWQRLQVIFSGHEVPGEGEHKIIDFIRGLKSQPDYCPNTRHCMAGLDADLVMLALATHEPNFSLLREQIDFGAFKRRDSNPIKTAKTSDTKWQVLQIGILREYLEMDMKPAGVVPFGYDGERVVDDFVLLTVLCGNDFIPHLPSLDIGEGALDLLLQYYREHLPSLGGYLVEEGVINFDRLEALTTFMGSLEQATLAKREADARRFARRGGGREVADEVEVDTDDESIAASSESSDVDLLDADGRESMDAAKLLSQLSLHDYKGRYYIEKFGTVGADPTTRTRIVKSFVEALQWVMLYYTWGVPSWGWFYPFHYAPMTSDLTSMSSFRIEFVKGAPFKPFQQLLGCLPAASAKFLPACYRDLMTSPDSPIASAFPDVNDIKVDMNGKRNPWEGVVLIPFIDEVVMLRAIADRCPDSDLTPDETARNRFGHEWTFTFAPENSDPLESTLPGVFPTIPRSQTRAMPYYPPVVSAFALRPLPGAVYPSPGFPTLFSTAVSVNREKVGINVFGQGPSKKETLVVYVANGRIEMSTGYVLPPHVPTFSIAYAEGTGPNLVMDKDGVDDPVALTRLPLADLASALLGTVVSVNWPHLREAKVMTVADAGAQYKLVTRYARKGRAPVPTVTRRDHSDVEKAQFFDVADGYRHSLLTGGGQLRTAGIRVADINQLVNVRLLIGMRRDPASGALLQEFAAEGSDGDIVVPAQLVFRKNPAPDMRFIEQPPLSVEERIPIGSSAVITSGPKRGHLCVVQGFTPEGNVIVDVPDRPKEPPFGYSIVGSIKDKYFDASTAASAAGIHPGLLSFISGSVILRFGDRDSCDIGLRFRAHKDSLYLEGYLQPLLPATQTVAAAWKSGDSVTAVTSLSEVKIRFLYSEAAVQIVAAYKRQFPKVFTMIQEQFDTAGGGKFHFSVQSLGGVPALDKIRKWLGQLDCAQLPLVPITTRSIPRLGIRAVEIASERVLQATVKAMTEHPSVTTLELSPAFLYRREADGYHVADESGSIVYGADVPLPNLGDRIVNLGYTGAPLGLRGTVVTIYPNTGFVSVVFDEEFISGTSIEKACLKRCAAVVRWDKLLPISKPDGLGEDALAALPGSGTVLKSEPRKVDVGMTPMLGKPLPSHPPMATPSPASVAAGAPVFVDPAIVSVSSKPPTAAGVPVKPAAAPPVVVLKSKSKSPKHKAAPAPGIPQDPAIVSVSKTSPAAKPLTTGTVPLVVLPPVAAPSMTSPTPVAEPAPASASASQQQRPAFAAMMNVLSGTLASKK